MAFDGLFLVVMGPVSEVIVQHVDVEASPAGEDHGDFGVVLLDALAGLDCEVSADFNALVADAIDRSPPTHLFLGKKLEKF